MNKELFTYIWQYTIHPELESEFLEAYQPDGEWACLFSRDPNYIKTELLQDSKNKAQYMTIDYWTSEAARDAFRSKYGREYDELDERCDSYTRSETLIGDFITIKASQY